MDSKKYSNTKLVIGISRAVFTFLLILSFVASGLSSILYNYLSSFSNNNYIVFLLFTLITGTGMGVIFFPVSLYSQYILEHKYNLSNQTFIKWIWESVKGIFISLLLGIPVLLLFYYLLNRFNELWWLPFAAGMFIISVILAKVIPVFILPLFYKLTPLEETSLIEKIKFLALDSGIKVESVFKFDMSKNTKKANAAFTGLGKSKRILLGDTLLNSYTEDEIETVIAHELGHYKKKHIIKNLIIGTISSFFTLFIIALLYKTSLPWFGFHSITHIPALPLLTLWGMLLGIIQTPLTNMLSRRYEYEADEYAIISTGKPDAFMNTLKKLTEQNLGDKDPHPLIEWFFYSHPSINNRIAAINQLKAAGEGSTI